MGRQSTKRRRTPPIDQYAELLRADIIFQTEKCAAIAREAQRLRAEFFDSLVTFFGSELTDEQYDRLARCISIPDRKLDENCITGAVTRVVSNVPATSNERPLFHR